MGEISQGGKYINHNWVGSGRVGSGRVGSGRDRDRDGHPDFFTNWDRDRDRVGQPDPSQNSGRVRMPSPEFSSIFPGIFR